MTYPCLSAIGVRPVIQERFSRHMEEDMLGRIVFSYGEESEVYGLKYHYLPLSQTCWISDPESSALVTDIYIAFSAAECLAFAECHFSRMGDFDRSLFIALGRQPTCTQIEWLRKQFPWQRKHLIFGNDFLGRAWDCRIATRLAQKAFSIAYPTDGFVEVQFRSYRYSFPEDRFSLCAFQKATGFRTTLRTHKPRLGNTFLEALQGRNLRM